jgi:putative chitinase
MMDQKAFFDTIREHLFDGFLDQSQVDGINALIAAWTKATADLRWQAYGLATAYHETDQTMHPVAELGHGHDKLYGHPDPVTKLSYYGRGYVQLTWVYNYQRIGDLIGVDLYHSPERAMEPDIAAKIMTRGMIDGIFTGKKLSDYFNHKATDWVNARRIVNGLDRANIIASYAIKIWRAMNEQPPFETSRT